MFPLGYRCMGIVYRRKSTMAARNVKYDEAVCMLNQLQFRTVPPNKGLPNEMGLIAMRKLLKRVNVTEEDIDRMKIIHVSGTKGKGSTCAFVESILRHNGVLTGFFSSPHLIEVRERIRLNGKPISHDLFAKYFWEVYSLLESTKDDGSHEMPWYFFYLTTMAFYIFKLESIDAVVLEVGIGGAYDCTNVVRHPVVCGITSLGIDHTKVLGKTIEEIAWQKAGILKKNVPAFTVNQPDKAAIVLQERAQEIGTSLNIVSDLNKYWNITEVALGMAGDFQKINASLAIQLAYCWLNRGLLATPLALGSSYINGLSNCQWNGRAQILKFKSITFYLDGAHTKKSIEFAASWFKNESAKEQTALKMPCLKVLSFNVSNGRNVHDLLSALVSCNFDTSIFTPNVSTVVPSNCKDQDNLRISVDKQLAQVLSHRDEWINLCASQAEMKSHSSTNVFPTIADAIFWMSKGRDKNLFNLSQAMTMCASSNSNDDVVCSSQYHLQVLITGSLYLVGGYLRILKPDINN